MKQIPLYDATAPIACTITTAELPQRIELIERMLANLTGLERTAHGMVLHFSARPDIEADLRQFAIEEKRCCQFWGFEVLTGEGLALRWDAPPTANDIVDQLEALLGSDQPASALAGSYDRPVRPRHPLAASADDTGEMTNRARALPTGLVAAARVTPGWGSNDNTAIVADASVLGLS